MERWTKQFMTLWILCMLLPMIFLTVMGMERIGEEYSYRGEEGIYSEMDIIQYWVLFIIICGLVGFMVEAGSKEQALQNSTKKRGTKR